MIVFTHYYLAFYNEFNTYVMFDVWLYQFYNIFFTSYPIIIFGMFDKQFKDQSYVGFINYEKNTLEDKPSYYLDGVNNHFFNSFLFWKNIILAVFYSGVIFYFVFY